MVEATLKERKFTLTGEGHAAGLVALDPLGKLAELYGVQRSRSSSSSTAKGSSATFTSD